MKILAFDPGPEKTAWVLYDADARKVEKADISQNRWLEGAPCGATHLAIEMIACYGMPVGAETFDTCVWIGRFLERYYDVPSALVYRRDVKLHLCGSARAKDPNVRQALMDMFGGSAAKGTKKQPGPLYGIKTHLWAALGVAVTRAHQLTLRDVAA